MLKIHNLSYAFTDKYLFDDINLNISSGNCLKVSGANGSGKSTLLKNIAGILTNYDGEIELNNQNIKDIPYEISSKIFYLGHKHSLKNNLSVLENIHYDFRSNLLEIELVLEHLKEFNFHESFETFIGNLSEGQKKKILLAIFAASKANIYILDEPFANLDRNGFGYLSKIIEEKNNNNDVIIYTSHEDKISFTKELNIDDYK